MIELKRKRKRKRNSFKHSSTSRGAEALGNRHLYIGSFQSIMKKSKKAKGSKAGFELQQQALKTEYMMMRPPIWRREDSRKISRAEESVEELRGRA
jgi:hypothetical protein